MKKYKVKIKGMTPLLMNKPEEYGFDEQWVEKKASQDWEKDALKKLYIDSKKRIYQPATHIEGCLIEAGKKVKVKGQGKATYSKLFGSMYTKFGHSYKIPINERFINDLSLIIL